MEEEETVETIYQLPQGLQVVLLLFKLNVHPDQNVLPSIFVMPMELCQINELA